MQVSLIGHVKLPFVNVQKTGGGFTLTSQYDWPNELAKLANQ